MSQRFTVELERIPVMRATITVTATDISDARDQAIFSADAYGLWSVERSDAHVVKITAHANEPEQT